MRVRRSLVDALAGARRVAEDADEVVDELEGDPQHPTGLAEPVDRLLVGAGEHGTGLQGQGEGVGARLLRLHRQALGEGGGAEVEREAYVGELAGRGRVQGGVEEVEQPVRRPSTGAPHVATARTAAVRARSPARIAAVRP